MVKENQGICPCCGQPAVKDGNKITCENCDAVFEVKKTGSATVKKLGPIDFINQRLDKIESELFAESDDQPKPDDQNKDDDGDQEEDIL